MRDTFRRHKQISLQKLNNVMINNVKEWSDKAAKVLVGRKIVDARYMNDEEMEMMDWQSRPLCFVLDDGTTCILSMDDEGNDGGALFYGERGVFPTL